MPTSFRLSERAAAFHRVVRNAEFTLASGRKLSLEEGVRRALGLLMRVRKIKNSVYIIGNGGSSAIASHAITDFVNVASLRAQTLHEPSLTTCLANDYGYENGFSRQVAAYADKNDVLVAVSSSGRSKNILNAVEAMKRRGGRVMTLSGFDPKNPLRRSGELNIWVDSNDYGQVEIAHLFILHHLADRFGAFKKRAS